MARLLLLLLILSLFACTNLEDANIPERETFIRFFGGAASYTSVVMEPDLDGGFILAGNVAPIEDAEDDTKYPGIILVKTNSQGTKTWETIIRHANVHSIKPLADGYLVTGDSIQLSPDARESSEIMNTRLLLMKLSSTGDLVQRYSKDSTTQVLRGSEPVDLAVDFKGYSSVLVNNGTEIATLGSYKAPGGEESTVTMGFNLADIKKPIWRKNLDLQNFDYVSTNFVGLSNNNLVWASTANPSDANQVKYISVISVPPNYASPSNNSLFGKTDEGAHDVLNVQPGPTGFAAIGTYTNKAGNKNVFFLKIDPAGNVIEESARYFDCGAVSSESIPIEKTTAGVSQDDGTAVTYTKDGGFVLACSMLETPDKGNGGTDIVLIKIDAFGNFKWDKLMGGSGNEVATSIRELSDGTLLIAGTSTISNVSSMFIIRADGNGELKE